MKAITGTQAQIQSYYQELNGKIQKDESGNEMMTCICHGDLVTLVYQPLTNEVKKAKGKTAIQQLRAEFKAYQLTEIVYDVFCDRVNFYGFDNRNLYYNFFTVRHNIMIDRDRSGYSIDIKDAKSLGLPLDQGSYFVSCKNLKQRGY